jgi:hypothetical protein
MHTVTATYPGNQTIANANYNGTIPTNAPPRSASKAACT